MAYAVRHHQRWWRKEGNPDLECFIATTDLVRCQNSVQCPDQVFLIELGCSPVLVDQSVQDSVMSDRGIERDHGG
ncbi:MAG: hypothetical protein QOH50_5537, partial [Kribbellaceae bacterium]|nr:hypothetical protein [Kribbellaceae bacterium]